MTLLPAWADQRVMVRRLRIAGNAERARVVFDLTAPAEHKVFTLGEPDRVVVDLATTSLDQAFSKPDIPTELIRGIRHAPRGETDLRVVFDLDTKLRPHSFLLRPKGERGHRLVLDLETPRPAAEPVMRAQAAESEPREVVVAIDPGHGGRDPGAVGPGGTFEKDIVLAVSQRLARLLKQETGVKPILIRERDEYLPLRERTRRARQARADLFISVHADASRSHRVRGSSVYVLSQRGASSELARWLARRENDADADSGLANGLKLDGKDDMVTKVLLDLSQTDTIGRSQGLGEELLRQIERVNTVHSDKVERAGFVVLKSLDMPSALVETAFISNPAEEKRLRSGAFQQTIAKAMFRGIMRYFEANAPANTQIAQRLRQAPEQYTIRPGDTLSEIAVRHGVSVHRLRRYNELNSDVIKIGQTLRIPMRGST